MIVKNDTESKILFFFTSQYPYGTGESFIENELALLSGKFSQIRIFPLTGQGVPRTIPLNAEVVNWTEGYAYNGRRVLKDNFLLIFRILFTEFIASGKKLRFISQLPALKSILLRNVARAECIKNYLPESKPNVKNVFYTFWFEDWAIVLGVLKENKVIDRFHSRVHGFDLYSERRPEGDIPFRSFQMKTVKKIFAVSKDAVAYLKMKFPGHAGKIRLNHLAVVDNGINPFSQEQPFTIVSCSNIIPLKRVGLIVEILKKVRTKVQWIHFGDGPLRLKLVADSKALPPNVSVDIRGQTPHAEIIDFYRNNPVNLMIHLSETEGGVAIAVQEAASFGIPLIATNVGGLPEIVTDETGILIPVDFDAAQLAQLIDEFGSGFRNTSEFRTKCRQFWKETFDANKNCNVLYEELIN